MSPPRLRAVGLIFALGARRWFNRWLSIGSRSKKRRNHAVEGEHRRATAAPRRPGIALLAALGAVAFALNIVGQTARLAVALSAGDSDLVGPIADVCMATIENQADQDEEDDPDVEAQGAPKSSFDEDHLRKCFVRDLRARGLEIEEQEPRITQAVEQFRTFGRGSFRTLSAASAAWPDPRSWPNDRARASRICAAVLTLVAAGLALLAMGAGEARTLEEDLSALFSLPVPTTALLSAKAIEFSFFRAVGWVVGGSLVFALSLVRSWGNERAILMAVLGALHIGAIAGSVELAGSLGLRALVRPSRARTVQALAGVLGTSLLVVLFLLAVPKPGAFERFPHWLAYAPGGCLMAVIDGGRDVLRAGSLAIVLAWTFGLPIAAVALSYRMVSRGLVATAGEVGSRAGRQVGSEQASLFAPLGAVGAQLRWLVRDRRGIAQAVLVPLAILALQISLNPSFFESLRSNLGRTAAAGFGMAGYAAMFSAAGVLAVEGNGLWLLCSLPRPLYRILLERTATWSAFSLVYVAVTAAIGLASTGDLVGAIIHIPWAIAGAIVFSFIAAGLGILSTDPLAPRRRYVGAGATYLYLGLVALYARGLAADSFFAQVVSLIFHGMLALALWQKAKDKLPYLLDPNTRPRKTIDLSDGLLAAATFFVLQAAALLALLAFDLSFGASIGLAYALAAIVVVAGAAIAFTRSGIHDILDAVGLRARRVSLALLGSLVALMAAVAAAAGARAYLKVVERFWPDQLGRAEISLPPHDAHWLAVTAVLAAPLFEEILFRGIIYRGLRRTWPAWAAGLASAAMFAACHPPIAMAPVFVVGAVAALMFEWTGSLWAPMALHATYNAIVVFASR